MGVVEDNLCQAYDKVEALLSLGMGQMTVDVMVVAEPESQVVAEPESQP
jgi:hypothetical protein